MQSTWRDCELHQWVFFTKQCALLDMGVSQCESFSPFSSDSPEVVETLSLILVDLGTKLKTSGCIAEALEKYDQALKVW
jgi:hypothetical protein